MKPSLYAFLCLLSVEAYSQASKSVDFISADADIKFDLSERKVLGNIKYEMHILSPTDSIFIDAKNMDIKQVKINDLQVKYLYQNNKIALYQGYKEGKNTLTIQYQTTPKSAMYWVGVGTDMQIWTQGQGKDNSHWIPSFDDPNEKVIFSTKITFDKAYQVIANGNFVSKNIVGNDAVWTYKMNAPMSSYLLMLAIGKYIHKLEKSKSGVPIENYFLPSDSHKYAYTFEHSAKILDLLEDKIGVKYPWSIYRNIPAKDFMYSGMENTTATIFNQDFVVDEIGKNDRSFVNVNAHEMAHQWFGNLVTAKNKEDHWLQEGFATYYALVVERELYGNEHFYWELYQMAQQIQREVSLGKNTKVVSPKATTTTYYQKGAWAIYYLSTKVGEENLKQIVKNFLNKYAYKNASTQDFLDEITNVVPNFDKLSFEKNWLYNSHFPIKEAIKSIEASPWVKNYLNTIALQSIAFHNKKDQLYTILQDHTSGLPAQREVIFQLHKVPYTDAKEFYTLVMQSPQVKLRQALVQIIDEIPTDFAHEYKKLLQDPSYITREIVLKNLWIQYPKDQHTLLDNTQKWQGMPDKNLRITWLKLALQTENYHPDKKANWYRELEYYATNNFSANVRQNAINAMWYLNPYDSNVLPKIINGLTHHNTYFSRFCREAIKNLSQRKEFKEYFLKQIPYLPKDEHLALKNVMENI